MDCTPLAYPIILIHGWTDKPTHTGTWKVVERRLAERGVQFFVPNLPRFGSIEERVRLCIEAVAQHYPWGQPVHLIGHSMGGLVARAVAGRDGLPFTVLTVTTLGSPNRGLKYLDGLPSLDGNSKRAQLIRSVFGTDLLGLCNLSTTFMARFNETTLHNSNARYFSWAGEIRLPTISYAAHQIFVGNYYSKHDGVVGVDSAIWGPDLGPGTHLGTIAGLTHSSIVANEVFDKTLPHLLAAELGGWAPVKEVRSGLTRQVTRHVVGLANAVQRHHYAKEDQKRHGSYDRKTIGYAFNSNEGYMYN